MKLVRHKRNGDARIRRDLSIVHFDGAVRFDLRQSASAIAAWMSVDIPTEFRALVRSRIEQD